MQDTFARRAWSVVAREVASSTAAVARRQGRGASRGAETVRLRLVMIITAIAMSGCATTAAHGNTAACSRVHCCHVRRAQAAVGSRELVRMDLADYCDAHWTLSLTAAARLAEHEQVDTPRTC